MKFTDLASGRLLDLGREVEEIEHPLGGGEPALDGVVEAHELVDGVEEPAHEGHERQDGAKRDVPGRG